MKPFWVVGRLDGFGREPKQRHELFESASKEARRLAKLHPGNSFYVLQVVSE